LTLDSPLPFAVSLSERETPTTFQGGKYETPVSQQTLLKKIQPNISTYLSQFGSLLWHFAGNR
jgi:hypothetical protein